MADNNLDQLIGSLSGTPFVSELIRRNAMPTIRYGQTPGNVAGNYHAPSHTITLHPNVASSEQRNVLLHELAHAFQNKTTGMQANDPTDAALRSRVGAPANSPELDRSIAEGSAQYLGPNKVDQTNSNPLMLMALRSLMRNMFGKSFGE